MASNLRPSFFSLLSSGDYRHGQSSLVAVCSYLSPQKALVLTVNDLGKCGISRRWGLRKSVTVAVLGREMGLEALPVLLFTAQRPWDG